MLSANELLLVGIAFIRGVIRILYSGEKKLKNRQRSPIYNIIRINRMHTRHIRQSRTFRYRTTNYQIFYRGIRNFPAEILNEKWFFFSVILDSERITCYSSVSQWWCVLFFAYVCKRLFNRKSRSNQNLVRRFLVKLWILSAHLECNLSILLVS